MTKKNTDLRCTGTKMITSILMKVLDIALNMFIKDQARKADLKADILKDSMAYERDSKAAHRLMREYEALRKEADEIRRNRLMK